MTYPICSSPQSNDQAPNLEQVMPLNATHTHVSGLDEPITPPNDCETSAVLSLAQTKKKPIKGPSAWMERSSFKSHFHFAFSDGRKIATCNYCGKPFKEGESTGNLSKHITALHSAALKENRVSKMQTLDTMARRSRPLKMSETLTRQLKKNPATLESILLIAEGFLPFSFVNLTTWGHLNSKYANNGFIQSRNTLTKKICRFRDILDEALQQNLKDTTMINVQLDIWTSGNNQSFLAVIASFAPNILNEKSLDESESAKILFNNSGETQNAHLLDFVSLEDKRHTGKNICSVFMSIMKKHNLLDKLGTVTMDNASNNENFHSNLIYEHFNGLKPGGHRLMGKVRFIRCASHVLNLQFQKIIHNLLQSSIFSNAFTKIRKLAKIMRYSTAVNASLRKHNLPLIPYESQTRWIFEWKQVKIFLENYQAYRYWLGDLEDAGQEHLVSRVKDHLTFDYKSVELLTYFVESCKIFDYLNSKFQDNEYNNLPQGIPLYYLLGHFYKCCLVVSTGKEIPRLTKTMDFSYLNGPSTLSLEEKCIVLEAINDAHFCYQNYLSYIQSNPLYYVAVMLDPTAKHEQLYKTMTVDEFTLRRNAVTSFIRSYLSEEKSTRCKDLAQVSAEEEVRNDDYRSFNVHEQPQLAQLPESESSPTNDDNEVLKEWHQYQKEPIICGKSRKEAIAWWYKHRRSYPCLFKLAMALFYTKLSSCDVERCFSLAGRVIREDRARLHKNNVRTLMILRDRFSNFSYYKKQPISVEELQEDLDLDWDEDEHEFDDEIMPESSDDTTSENEYSIKEISMESSTTTDNIQGGRFFSCRGDKSTE